MRTRLPLLIVATALGAALIADTLGDAATPRPHRGQPVPYGTRLMGRTTGAGLRPVV